MSDELLDATSGFVCGTAFAGMTCSALTAGVQQYVERGCAMRGEAIARDVALRVQGIVAADASA